MPARRARAGAGSRLSRLPDGRTWRSRTRAKATFETVQPWSSDAQPATGPGTRRPGRPHAVEHDRRPTPADTSLTPAVLAHPAPIRCGQARRRIRSLARKSDDDRPRRSVGDDGRSAAMQHQPLNRRPETARHRRHPAVRTAIVRLPRPPRSGPTLAQALARHHERRPLSSTSPRPAPGRPRPWWRSTG